MCERGIFMLQKKLDTYSTLLFSILCICLGILTILGGKTLLKYNIYLIAILIISLSLIHFFKFILLKDPTKKRIEAFIRLVVDFVFANIMVYFNDFIIASITVFFGIYIFIHSQLHLFNLYLYKVNQIKGKLSLLISFFITFILSILLISHPTKNIFFAEVIVGCYLIFLGIDKFNDFLREVIPTKYSNSLKSHIQIQLPILFAMFIPKQLISIINESLEIKKEDSFQVTKKQSKPDIEVIIHLATSGSASFGHVEIGFEDKIYSFGNYDKHSRAFFDAIGDGVICIADKKRYIEYALNNKKRYLVIFGIQLTKKEIKIIKERIHHLIYDNTIDYYPDLALYDQGKLKAGNYNDMSSEIYKLADGKFKKIIKGKNKKFFVLKTNCVMVANYILNGKDMKLVAINGIISPGSYYDYLNNEFLKKNSNVITRKIYTNVDTNNK